MRAFVPLVLLAVVTTGCGQEADRAARRPAEGGDTVPTTLYFLADDGSRSLGVLRNVVQRVPPPSWGSTPGGALEALLAGPTAEEAEPV